MIGTTTPRRNPPKRREHGLHDSQDGGINGTTLNVGGCQVSRPSTSTKPQPKSVYVSTAFSAPSPNIKPCGYDNSYQEDNAQSYYSAISVFDICLEKHSYECRRFAYTKRCASGSYYVSIKPTCNRLFADTISL